MRSKCIKKLRNNGQIEKSRAKKYKINNRESQYQTMGSARNHGTLEIKVLENFDMSQNAENIIKYLDDLKNKLNRQKVYDLHIDHSNTKYISLDASYLFDSMIRNYINYWKRLHINIIASGVVSNSKEVNNFLLSFGLLSELENVNTSKLFPLKADSDFGKKYIILKREGTSRKEYLAGNASTDMVDFFNKCFNNNGFKINDSAKSNLVDCFGEIIRNAEEHSGKNETKWIILGCYDKSRHSCSFSVINEGLTYYETLSQNTSTAKDALTDVEQLIYTHTSLFEKMKMILDKKLYTELIWTYMALQDGISSKRNLVGQGSTRGQGIMDVIEFIDHIRNKKEHETYIDIISGTSIIHIDYSYPLETKLVGIKQEKRRVMVLNNEKDFHMPPDLNKIKYMVNKYHGSIFSGNFVIDRNFLTSNMKGA
jgi:hypothetical protein